MIIGLIKVTFVVIMISLFWFAIMLLIVAVIEGIRRWRR